MSIKLVPIEDPDDLRLADYVRLRDVSLRRHLEVEQGLFIAEGEKVIRRALEAGYQPRSFLLAERWLASLAEVLGEHPEVPVYVVTEALAEKVTGFHVHRGALASLRRESRHTMAELLGNHRPVVSEDFVDDRTMGGSNTPALEPPVLSRSRIAVLEDLVDHTNVGAVFRNAAAFGVDGVFVTPRCADPLYRRSIKVSMGTVFQVPWARIESWPSGVDLLKEAGYVVAGMTLADDAITLDELVEQDHPRLALVFGTEGHGLAQRTSAALDVRVKIPMMGGVDSLNVAASSAVAFYVTR